MLKQKDNVQSEPWVTHNYQLVHSCRPRLVRKWLENRHTSVCAPEEAQPACQESIEQEKQTTIWVEKKSKPTQTSISAQRGARQFLLWSMGNCVQVVWCKSTTLRYVEEKDGRNCTQLLNTWTSVMKQKQQQQKIVEVCDEEEAQPHWLGSFARMHTRTVQTTALQSVKQWKINDFTWKVIN